MSDGIKYRPKRFIQYSFGNWNCIINCYPQQHWVQTNYREDDDKVRLEYKGIVMNISIDDFNTHWLMVSKQEIIEQIKEQQNE